MAFYVEVDNSVDYPFLTGVVPETGWLFGVENGRVYYYVWLKESPD
jgi:hypothetical protein